RALGKLKLFGVPTLHLTPHSSLLTQQHLSLPVSHLSRRRLSPSPSVSHLSRRRRSPSPSVLMLAISFSVLTQRLSASHLSRRRRSLSVLSPHSQPIISHAGDEAPQSSLSPTQSADLTLRPQSSQAAASILADLTLRPSDLTFITAASGRSFSPSVFLSCRQGNWVALHSDFKFSFSSYLFEQLSALKVSAENG
ncbi:hypothetical protein Ancab_004403, partial [Ancistrocladus abbreviatus]